MSEERTKAPPPTVRSSPLAEFRLPMRAPRPGKGDHLGRSPGSRVVALTGLPGVLPQWHCPSSLTAYSCGGSRGIAPVARPAPRSLFIRAQTRNRRPLLHSPARCAVKRAELGMSQSRVTPSLVRRFGRSVAKAGMFVRLCWARQQNRPKRQGLGASGMDAGRDALHHRATWASGSGK
jgi:hypothetical protein